MEKVWKTRKKFKKILQIAKSGLIILAYTVKSNSVRMKNENRILLFESFVHI